MTEPGPLTTVWWRVKEATGWVAARIALRWALEPLVRLDYQPSAQPHPRYGHGRPPHPELERLIAAGEERYAEVLDRIAAYSDDLARVPLREPDPPGAYWLSRWLLGLDCASLYALVRDGRPARYVEVGSGMSTMWARQAVRDGALATEIVSIDPHPRADIDRFCDHVVRTPLESADLSLFDGLAAGDIVFMDGSHRAFMNSDATVFFLDVMPRLAAGVTVGVHDVLLPHDYPPEWSDWHYSEQYLLATWLLGGSKGIDVLLPCFHASQAPALAARVEGVWPAGVDPRGFTFWFHTQPGHLS